MDTVVQDTLLSTRQHLFALIRSEPKHLHKFSLGERNGSLASCRNL